MTSTPIAMAASVTTSSLEASVEATLSTVRAQLPQRRAQPFTIFRVPAYVRESNRTAYEPRMVSIGPYHHGAAALRAMEDHKWRYLHDLLSRSTAGVSSSSTLLVQEMRSLEPRARACYSERPMGLIGSESDEFVRMLLLDASFILEFFFKWHTKCPDTLCDVGWARTLIATDLLLLENQIPFFVVEKLYDVIVAGAHGHGSNSSRENLFNLFLEYIGIKHGATPSDTSEINHLLHLLYESVVVVPRPSQSPPMGPPSSELLVRVIPRAAEMSAAGVTFVARRRSSDDRGAHDYDVAFDASRGVMEVPVVEIDDMNRPLLINLIAFEQSLGGEEGRLVMSYVNLMSMLVRTAEDVALLRRKGVLVNLLSDDDEAARFFSHLGDGSAMNYRSQVFAGLYRDVDRYCGSWWHRNLAALRRDYFGSPWSAVSFVVAGVAVALTATQTYFTVFPSSSSK